MTLLLRDDDSGAGLELVEALEGCMRADVVMNSNRRDPVGGCVSTVPGFGA